jgi:hypothetical protein
MLDILSVICLAFGVFKRWVKFSTVLQIYYQLVMILMVPRSCPWIFHKSVYIHIAYPIDAHLKYAEQGKQIDDRRVKGRNNLHPTV